MQCRVLGALASRRPLLGEGANAAGTAALPGVAQGAFRVFRDFQSRDGAEFYGRQDRKIRCFRIADRNTNCVAPGHIWVWPFSSGCAELEQNGPSQAALVGTPSEVL